MFLFHFKREEGKICKESRDILEVHSYNNSHPTRQNNLPFAAGRLSSVLTVSTSSTCIPHSKYREYFTNWQNLSRWKKYVTMPTVAGEKGSGQEPAKKVKIRESSKTPTKCGDIGRSKEL